MKFGKLVMGEKIRVTRGAPLYQLDPIGLLVQRAANIHLDSLEKYGIDEIMNAVWFEQPVYDLDEEEIFA